jgi:hypothetical protein
MDDRTFHLVTLGFTTLLGVGTSIVGWMVRSAIDSLKAVRNEIRQLRDEVQYIKGKLGLGREI